MNHPSSNIPESPRLRVSAIQLDAIRLALSERDIEILRTLASYRLATGEQLQRLHFTGHTTTASATRSTSRVLGRLHALRLVDRLERRIGGVHAGSAGYVWHLASAGRRILATENPTHLARVAAIEPVERTVRHTLAITEVGVRLHEESLAGQLDVIESVPEPAAWRSYLGIGGGRSILKLDLWAVTAHPDSDHEDLWFIEVDMGREPIATVLRKATQYQTYRQTGTEQQAQGAFPRVIWLTPNQKRAGHITDALKRTHGIDNAIHTALTLDEFIDHATKGGHQ